MNDFLVDWLPEKYCKKLLIRHFLVDQRPAPGFLTKQLFKK